MRICVLGAGGLLGHMLIRILSESHDVHGSTKEMPSDSLPLSKFLSQDKWIGGVNALDPPSFVRVFESNQFDVVINCIGLIKQRNQDSDDRVMMKVNGEFPHALAQVANKHGVKVFQVSTDCVFSGISGNYVESDQADPIDTYGKSKLQGEIVDKTNLTLRTSHIGRELSVRKSFAEWVLSQKGKQVNGYRHAIYSGLTTQELSKVISAIIVEAPKAVGLFHISSESISKLEIINKLNELLDLQIKVIPDDSVQIDRSLNSNRFWEMMNLQPQNWDAMLTDFYQDQKFYE